LETAICQTNCRHLTARSVQPKRLLAMCDVLSYFMFGRMSYNNVQSDRWLPTFRRNIINLFYVEKIVLFGLKLYNEQCNAQVFNLFSIYSALHILNFLLAHLQRQVYDFGSGPSLLGMVSAPALTP
jgi:hypothetical protein